MVIAPLFSEAQRGLDISCLRAFIATAQQNDDRVATPLKIHPVTGAIMDSKLTDTFPHGFGVSNEAEGQAIKAGSDSGANALIFEVHPPISKGLGLLQFDHGTSVVCKLRQSKRLKPFQLWSSCYVGIFQQNRKVRRRIFSISKSQKPDIFT
jgi:hypothetical protein